MKVKYSDFTTNYEPDEVELLRHRVEDLESRVRCLCVAGILLGLVIILRALGL